jgi:hypothetical protein
MWKKFKRFIFNNSNRYRWFISLTVYLLFFLSSCRKGKGAICNDGWRSHSTGSGTCSWHDGIDHYIDPNEIDTGRTALLIILVVFGIIFIRASNKN